MADADGTLLALNGISRGHASVFISRSHADAVVSTFPLSPKRLRMTIQGGRGSSHTPGEAPPSDHCRVLSHRQHLGISVLLLDDAVCKLCGKPFDEEVDLQERTQSRYAQLSRFISTRLVADDASAGEPPYENSPAASTIDASNSSVTDADSVVLTPCSFADDDNWGTGMSTASHADEPSDGPDFDPIDFYYARSHSRLSDRSDDEPLAAESSHLGRSPRSIPNFFDHERISTAIPASDVHNEATGDLTHRPNAELVWRSELGAWERVSRPSGHPAQEPRPVSPLTDVALAYSRDRKASARPDSSTYDFQPDPVLISACSSPVLRGSPDLSTSSGGTVVGHGPLSDQQCDASRASSLAEFSFSFSDDNAHDPESTLDGPSGLGINTDHRETIVTSEHVSSCADLDPCQPQPLFHIPTQLSGHDAASPTYACESRPLGKHIPTNVAGDAAGGSSPVAVAHSSASHDLEAGILSLRNIVSQLDLTPTEDASDAAERATHPSATHEDPNFQPPSSPISPLTRVMSIGMNRSQQSPTRNFSRASSFVRLSNSSVSVAQRSESATRAESPLSSMAADAVPGINLMPSSPTASPTKTSSAHEAAMEDPFLPAAGQVGSGDERASTNSTDGGALSPQIAPAPLSPTLSVRGSSPLSSAFPGRHSSLREPTPNLEDPIRSESNSPSSSRTSSLDKSLYRAIYAGDLEKAQQLLRMGTDADVVHGDHGILAAAAMWGHAAVGRSMAAHAISAVGGKCTVCTFSAVDFSQESKLVRALLAHGINPNYEGGLCGSPLATAAWMGKVDIVTALLEHGASRTQTAGKYRHVLCAAAAEAGFAGNLAVVKTLVQCGVSVRGFGPHGNALSLAMKRRDFWRFKARDQASLEAASCIENCELMIAFLQQAEKTLRPKKSSASLRK